MAIQYGQYNLANSQNVRPFAGSPIRELTSVAGTLQERYEKALEQDDLLSRAVSISQAAPFAQDQQILADMKEEFKNKMRVRASQGDYENMVRDTMIDARNFSDRYSIIADNAKRYQEYQNQLQEQVAKGDIKSPDKARRLLTLSTQGYSGLQYNPNTGQYSNQFRGMPAVKDIDPTKKVDDWMKDLAPTILGSKVVFTDGVWKKFQEGKTTTLKQDEIDRILQAGMQSDPEFQGWLNQERQLAGVDYNNITVNDIGKMKPGPVKDAMVQAWQSGIEPREALQQIFADRRSNDVVKSMRQYSSKYIRDDREVGSGIISADEYALQAHKKKLDEEELVLSMPILQPEARVEIRGADDLTTKMKDASAAAKTLNEKYYGWIDEDGVTQDENGNWKDKNGNDVTMKMLEFDQLRDQTYNVYKNLRDLDKDARNKTGYGKGTLTPALLKKAEQIGLEAAERLRVNISEGSGGFRTATDEELAQAKERAKTEYLAKNAPGYAQYNQALKDMTTKGSQLVNVQNFSNTSANKQALNLFKNLVLNLDAGGLNSGTQGLTWASGDATGDPLEGDDYKKVVADAEFAGWGMDTDGELKYFYKVGGVKQNSKGKTVGEQALVKMPALPGTVDVLIKDKQITPAQLIIGRDLNQVLNGADGKGVITVGNEVIRVQRLNKTDVNEPSTGIKLYFPASDGTETVVPVRSVGEAINTITNVIQRTQAKKK